MKESGSRLHTDAIPEYVCRVGRGTMESFKNLIQNSRSLVRRRRHSINRSAVVICTSKEYERVADRSNPSIRQHVLSQRTTFLSLIHVNTSDIHIIPKYAFGTHFFFFSNITAYFRSC